MNFHLPSKNGWTIYTKENCPYCVKAKELLKDLNPLFISCDDYLKEHRDSFLAFIELQAGTSHKTFPMIFYSQSFIGGFTETQNFYNKQNVSFDESFDN